jgi:hypothetical protein
MYLKFGGKSGTLKITPLIPLVPTFATAGTISETVLPENLKRTGLLVINTSANIVSMAFGYPAVLYSGITLSANGGSWEMSPWTLSVASISVIASGAGSNLSIQEYE